METIEQNLQSSRGNTGHKTSPKDFFFYLASLVTLYVSVISILTLLFGVVDQMFPKQFQYTDPYAGGVSLAIAMLIVMFPLYLIVTRFISKEEVALPEKREVWVRKAFVYCTLFLSVLVIAIDLIVLFNSFFSGEEITLAFGLKVFSVVVVLLAVASYYYYDLRRTTDDTGARTRKIYGYGSSMFIMLAIVLGFWIMGSPYAQKEKRFDAERVNHLQIIQSQIISYWTAKEKLPNTIKDLEDPLINFIPSVDPKTQAAYEYIKTGDLSFELCAVFGKETPLSTTRENFSMPVYPYGDAMNENWKHGVGRTCFKRTIDPDRYKNLYPKPIPVQ